jgi:MFS family permease
MRMAHGVSSGTVGGDVAAVQQRTMIVLGVAQLLAGVGLAASAAFGALVAAELVGRRDLAGVLQAAQVMGAGVVAMPAARLSARYGRRVGVSAAYGLATTGAALAVVAAAVQAVGLLLLASVLLGGGAAASLQARFVATDLAEPASRVRSLSLVLSVTGIGAVVGPNIFVVALRLGETVGVEPLLGVLLLSGATFAAAALVALVGLRPDSLSVSRGEATAGSTPPTSTVPAMRAARASRVAWTGIVVACAAQTILVVVGVVAPFMTVSDGAGFVRVFGLVISGQAVGMYAASLVLGWLADRGGRMALALAGAAMLLVASFIATTAMSGPVRASQLTVGLVLLGLGWSACLVASSAMVVDGVRGPQALSVQGMSDAAMNLSAAIGGVLAGVAVSLLGFTVLAWAAAALAAALLVLLMRRGRPDDEHVTAGTPSH